MMSLKKVLTFSSASVALLSCAVVYAGGPEVIAPPACPVCAPYFAPFIYIGGDLGWAYSDWASFIVSGLPSSAGTNGFTYGGKVGYQFLDHFGIEAGIYGLPNSDQTVTFDDPLDQSETLTGTVNSWFAYGAGTLRVEVPVIPFLYAIGKFGGGYRQLNRSGSLYSNDVFNVGNGGYSTVIFGGSLEYDLGAYNLPLAIGIDYLYVPASTGSFFTTTNINADAAPAAQVVVGSLSVRFAV